MLRCVFWNAPTVYYNIAGNNNATRSKRKKLSMGTRARDSNDVRQQPPRRTRRVREIAKKNSDAKYEYYSCLYNNWIILCILKKFIDINIGGKYTCNK